MHSTCALCCNTCYFPWLSQTPDASLPLCLSSCLQGPKCFTPNHPCISIAVSRKQNIVGENQAIFWPKLQICVATCGHLWPFNKPITYRILRWQQLQGPRILHPPTQSSYITCTMIGLSCALQKSFRKSLSWTLCPALCFDSTQLYLATSHITLESTVSPSVLCHRGRTQMIGHSSCPCIYRSRQESSSSPVFLSDRHHHSQHIFIQKGTKQLLQQMIFLLLDRSDPVQYIY